VVKPAVYCLVWWNRPTGSHRRARATTASPLIVCPKDSVVPHPVLRDETPRSDMTFATFMAHQAGNFRASYHAHSAQLPPAFGQVSTAIRMGYLPWRRSAD
jgi:hypothetical protein